MVPTSPAEGIEKLHILLVEDDSLVRETTSEGLRELGFIVFEAADAAEALASVAVMDRIDAVFTDIRMPGTLDGIDLALRLRRTHPALPVILTSADQIGAAADSSLPFVQKPYRFAQLGALLKELTGNFDR